MLLWIPAAWCNQGWVPLPPTPQIWPSKSPERSWSLSDWTTLDTIRFLLSVRVLECFRPWQSPNHFFLRLILWPIPRCSFCYCYFFPAKSVTLKCNLQSWAKPFLLSCCCCWWWWWCCCKFHVFLPRSSPPLLVDAENQQHSTLGLRDTDLWPRPTRRLSASRFPRSEDRVVQTMGMYRVYKGVYITKIYQLLWG